ncbi:hypothetical protein VBZ67_06585 [Campylobacter concisus]
MAEIVTSKAQLKASIKAIKEKSPKIFIAIDEEGGNVSRMKDKSFDGPYPSAYEVASTLDIKSAYDLYSKMAINLKECGSKFQILPQWSICTMKTRRSSPLNKGHLASMRARL